ncbi:MAG: family 10 glycosylhydrolase [Spirulina sp. SIO3F2]|nr:family 10 glycosylhydrolase [Spirulina sp. SIO3F2]
MRCLKHCRRLTLFLLTLALVFRLWQAPTQPVTATNSIHGVWMTNLGAALMYYSTRLDEVVANLAQHQINTLYPAVWNRGYSLHSSRVSHAAGGRRRDWLTDIPLLPGDRILSELIAQGHRQGLRLIPWFEYGLMIPASNAIAQAHPDWLTTDITGATVRQPLTPEPGLPPALQNVQLEITGGNLAWLNPLHPEVQNFLVELIAEVVERYPVEGIQLDDHFGLPVELGYDDYTRQRYATEHGGASPPTNPRDPAWMAWRSRQLTTLMARIHQRVKAINPDAIISLSPNPPDFAYREYLQDWRSWVDQGLVDEVIVQLYRPDLTALKRDLANPDLNRIKQQLPIAIGLYTGPFWPVKPLDRLRTEIQTVQAAGYQGVSFFCWETTLWMLRHEPAEQVQQQFQTLLAGDS